MKKQFCVQLLSVLLTVTSVWLVQPTSAQTLSSGQKTTVHVNTDTKILYHNGLVMTGPADVYFIWYGCWDNTCGNNGDLATQTILSDFMSNIGATPYSAIWRGYPSGDGFIPSGAAFFGGSVFDQYSRGLELTTRIFRGSSRTRSSTVVCRRMQLEFTSCSLLRM